MATTMQCNIMQDLNHFDNVLCQTGNISDRIVPNLIDYYLSKYDDDQHSVVDSLLELKEDLRLQQSCVEDQSDLNGFKWLEDLNYSDVLNNTYKFEELVEYVTETAIEPKPEDLIKNDVNTSKYIGQLEYVRKRAGALEMEHEESHTNKCINKEKASISSTKESKTINNLKLVKKPSMFGQAIECIVEPKIVKTLKHVRKRLKTVDYVNKCNINPLNMQKCFLKMELTKQSNPNYNLKLESDKRWVWPTEIVNNNFQMQMNMNNVPEFYTVNKLKNAKRTIKKLENRKENTGFREHKVAVVLSKEPCSLVERQKLIYQSAPKHRNEYRTTGKPLSLLKSMMKEPLLGAQEDSNKKKIIRIKETLTEIMDSKMLLNCNLKKTDSPEVTSKEFSKKNILKNKEKVKHCKSPTNAKKPSNKNEKQIKTKTPKTSCSTVKNIKKVTRDVKRAINNVDKKATKSVGKFKTLAEKSTEITDKSLKTIGNSTKGERKEFHFVNMCLSEIQPKKLTGSFKIPRLKSDQKSTCIEAAHQMKTEETNRTLRVGQLKQGTTSGHLHSKFSRFGQIESIKLYDNDPRFNYALINFKSSLAAFSALNKGNCNSDHVFELSICGLHTRKKVLS